MIFSGPWPSFALPRWDHDQSAQNAIRCSGGVSPLKMKTAALAAAREVHSRIDAGGLGGKIVLLPWP
jgi:hypothetical protein